MTPALRYRESVSDWYWWRQHHRCDLCGAESDACGRDVFDIAVMRVLCRTCESALAEVNDCIAAIVGLRDTL